MSVHLFFFFFLLSFTHWQQHNLSTRKTFLATLIYVCLKADPPNASFTTLLIALCFFFFVKSLIIYSERAPQGPHKMVIAGTSLTLNLFLSSSSTRPCEDPASDDWLRLTKQLKPDAHWQTNLCSSRLLFHSTQQLFSKSPALTSHWDYNMLLAIPVYSPYSPNVIVIHFRSWPSLTC